MNLRSGGSYWPTTCPPPRLARNSRAFSRAALDVDVLIIGAGITGALAAYELSRAGVSVALVDGRLPGSGSTAASTALLQYELDTPLLKLRRLLSPRHANAAYRASHAALSIISRTVRALEVDVELARRPSLFLASRPGEGGRLRAEAAARRRLGIDAAFLSRRELWDRFAIDRPAAILSTAALEVNPLKLTYALVASAVRRGAVVLPPQRLECAALAAEHRPFRVPLSDGRELGARSVVMAGGYEVPEEFESVARLTELRITFAMATAPLRRSAWPQRALLWESSDPYFYARTTPDGRVLAGGEDEPFAPPSIRDSKIPAKVRTLSRKLRGITGVAASVDFRWSGVFAQTRDGLPYIGTHSRWPDVYFALGYGGNGITFSALAARIITAAVLGRKHPDANLFRFDR